MAVKSDHQLMLRKLKKQIRALQRKEEAAKSRLRAALLKTRKLSKVYKIKLAAKVRASKAKIAEARLTSYAKAAEQIERQLVRGIETRGKALVSALGKIERKYAAKLKKSVSRKSKTKAKSARSKK